MNELEKLRQQIDEIDKELLSILAKRLALVSKIGELKKEKKRTVVDKKREEQIIAHLSTREESKTLRKEFIRDLWGLIFRESYRAEKV